LRTAAATCTLEDNTTRAPICPAAAAADSICASARARMRAHATGEA
jgi:hypothetical protein